jgi:hypothetical protein
MQKKTGIIKFIHNWLIYIYILYII